MRLLILVASLAWSASCEVLHSDITTDLRPPILQDASSYARAVPVGDEKVRQPKSVDGDSGWIGLPPTQQHQYQVQPEVVQPQQYQVQPQPTQQVYNAPPTATGHKYTTVTFNNGLVGLGHSVDYSAIRQSQAGQYAVVAPVQNTASQLHQQQINTIGPAFGVGTDSTNAVLPVTTVARPVVINTAGEQRPYAVKAPTTSTSNNRYPFLGVQQQQQQPQPSSAGAFDAYRSAPYHQQQHHYAAPLHQPQHQPQIETVHAVFLQQQLPKEHSVPQFYPQTTYGQNQVEVLPDQHHPFEHHPATEAINVDHFKQFDFDQNLFDQHFATFGKQHHKFEQFGKYQPLDFGSHYHHNHHHVNDHTDYHGLKHHRPAILAGLTGGLSSKLRPISGPSLSHHHGVGGGAAGDFAGHLQFATGLKGAHNGWSAAPQFQDANYAHFAHFKVPPTISQGYDSQTGGYKY